MARTHLIHPVKQKAKLQREAHKLGIPVNELIRRFIEDGLKNL